MKIWIITTDDDNGTGTAVYTTAESADSFASSWVNASWKRWFSANTACHDDWREALSHLTDQEGYLDHLTIAEHDISHHPAAMEAVAALGLAQDWFEMNNLEGEELPFIHDCEVAIALLTGAEPPQMDEETAAACEVEFGDA